MNRPIRIGSRGSALALWQANFIASELRRLRQAVEIEVIRTAGDRMQESILSAIPGKGIFTREIEEALSAERIDLAVHSLKDLPTELASEFILAAIPSRADPRDVLVSKQYDSLKDLPAGAVVGTGSPRRQAQLLRQRPDLTYIEFRGNVDTRLRKLAEGKADAIILAAAGLDRLQKADWVRQRFPVEILCPAAGQGALAIECRADDAATQAAVASLEDKDTRLAVTAERRFLAALGGGCQTPIGAFARLEEGMLQLAGMVAARDGSTVLRGTLRHPDPNVLGESLARQMLESGAAAILELEGISG